MPTSLFRGYELHLGEWNVVVFVVLGDWEYNTEEKLWIGHIRNYSV